VGGWRRFRKARPAALFRVFSLTGSPGRSSPASALVLGAPAPHSPIFVDPPDLSDPPLIDRSMTKFRASSSSGFWVNTFGGD
jgi:hypothetical protein